MNCQHTFETKKVAFPNWKYVESRGLVVYDWNLAVDTCFFGGQSDGYDAVPVKTDDLSAVNGMKGCIYPVARHCD